MKNSLLSSIVQNIQVIQLNHKEIKGLRLDSLTNKLLHNELDIHSLVDILNDDNTSCFIIQFLVNKLFDKFSAESYFYLPQLCSFMCYSNSVEMEKFIIYQCSNRMGFAILVYRYLLSLKAKDSSYLDLKAGKIESAIVNNKRKKSKKSKKTQIFISLGY